MTRPASSGPPSCAPERRADAAARHPYLEITSGNCSSHIAPHSSTTRIRIGVTRRNFVRTEVLLGFAPPRWYLHSRCLKRTRNGQAAKGEEPIRRVPSAHTTIVRLLDSLPACYLRRHV